MHEVCCTQAFPDLAEARVGLTDFDLPGIDVMQTALVPLLLTCVAALKDIAEFGIRWLLVPNIVGFD